MDNKETKLTQEIVEAQPWLLIEASEEGQLDRVKELIEKYNMDPNYYDKMKKTTALSVAVKAKHDHIIKYLIEAGGRDSYGREAYSYAVEDHNTELANFIALKEIHEFPIYTLSAFRDTGIKITTCEDYNRYLFDGYRIDYRSYDMLWQFSLCSTVFGERYIDEKEIKEVLNIIYDTELTASLPEYMLDKTPKELELTIGNGSVQGLVLESQYPDEEFPDAKPNYLGIYLYNKIEEDLYLVHVHVDYTIGTYISYEEYLFNVKTKTYSEFYRNFTPKDHQ